MLRMHSCYGKLTKTHVYTTTEMSFNINANLLDINGNLAMYTCTYVRGQRSEHCCLKGY